MAEKFECKRPRMPEVRLFVFDGEHAVLDEYPEPSAVNQVVASYITTGFVKDPDRLTVIVGERVKVSPKKPKKGLTTRH